jgi:DNA-binding response OmpR family regulator
MEKNMEKQVSILIVDDNKYAAQALGKLLEQNGHKVELAYDGEAALRIAHGSHVDAVILDIGLPGRSGYEIAHLLKETLRPPAVIIALTGYGQEEDKLMALDAGFDHHLTKPILSKEVEDVIFAHRAKIEKNGDER